MSSDLEYVGKPELRRRRELVEIPVDTDLSPLMRPDESDPIDSGSIALFTNLGRVYLKGEKLKEGLSAMAPAQFIPISDSADQVSRSAERLDEEGSKKGTIILFSLYRLCVNILADRQWKVRRIYENVHLPDTETMHKTSVEQYEHGGEDLDNIIKSFLSGDGVAGAILSALTISPWQIPGFALLSPEETAAKSYFALQVPVGIAVMVELGLKARRIKKLLKDANSSNTEVETLVNKLSESKEERHKVLRRAGLEPEKFEKSQKINDAKTILEYCNSYISSHISDSPEVYDHWIAYGNVTARQNLVRGALDTATIYSREFSEAFDRDRPSNITSGDVVINHASSNPQVKINSVIASHFNDLEKESDDAYDAILNSFMFQISDSDLCCVVELLGSMDPGGLRLISQILKIASVDLQAEIVLIQDAFYRLLVDASASATYGIISRVDKISDDLAVRMLTAIEDMQKKLGFELEHCPAFRDIGVALTFGIDAIRSKIELMLLDILNYIEQLGTTTSLVWHVPAERRYLLSMAKILDVLAFKLEAASVCEKREETRYQELVGEAKDQAANEIIHTLLDKSPPSIQISDDDIKKYFPNLKPSKSPRFGFTYGPKTIFPDRIGQRDEALNNCGSKVDKDRIGRVLSDSMAKAFGIENG